MSNIEYRPEIDGPVYEALAEFLPVRVFDSHIHTGLPQHIVALSDERKKSKLGFFLDVALEFGCNAYEIAQEVRTTLFPEQMMEGLYFGFPFRETDLDANNAYVAGLIEDHGVQGLYMPRPDSTRDELEHALDAGFIGFKPYLDLVTDKSFAEMRLADYVPPALWEVTNDRGAILLIHLGRPGRLYDRYDIEDLSGACRRHPAAKVIMAHIGRPYIPSMIRDGIPEPYKALPNLWFDVCPICESGVLEVAIREVGPQRLLFATDSPVTYMRGRLGEWNGDRKFFSDMDFPWNTEREPAEKETRYTFFVYEQLLGLKKAAHATRLSSGDVEDILYNNAKALTSEAG
ncbi:MAG: amidohydrolase family protein [Chloroflexi bacterium]|nr:amidohydrolase family protein [Chloroflexota bacterium]